jgi:hypothetical protein
MMAKEIDYDSFKDAIKNLCELVEEDVQCKLILTNHIAVNNVE